jgi:hypothetical protein
VQRVTSAASWKDQPGQLAILDCPLAVTPVPGQLDARNGKPVLDMLDAAIAAAMAGDVDAIVTAPVQKSTINDAGIAFTGHTEYLAEKTHTPQVVMMLVISGTGAVAKRVFAFDGPVDPGLVEWSREYLNETLTGGLISERTVRRRMEDPDLPVRERDFLDAIAPVFHELFEAGADRLVVGGASRLMSELRAQNQQELTQLASVLEERAVMLGQLRTALRGDSVTVRIGEEHEEAALRPVAMITAGYGLSHRTLGAVSVIGPVRMDYAQAIVAVRGAAAALSAYVEDVYEE